MDQGPELAEEDAVRDLRTKGLARCRSCGRLVPGGQHAGCVALTLLRRQQALRATADALPSLTPEQAGRTIRDIQDERRSRQSAEQEQEDRDE